MASTNKTTNYDLSQYVGTDKPTYLGDYNSDMLKIDTGIHEAAVNADTAVTVANSASATAATAATSASEALTKANSASDTADNAQATAETASTNAGAALVAAQQAVETANANPITNLAPAYDATLTYGVGELVTYGGKLYKCIIAVTQAMAFNLNYWDDVTTSEVYSKIVVRIFKASDYTERLQQYDAVRLYLDSIPDILHKLVILKAYADSVSYGLTYTLAEISHESAAATGSLNYLFYQSNIGTVNETTRFIDLKPAVGTALTESGQMTHTFSNNTWNMTYTPTHAAPTSDLKILIFNE